MNVRKVIGKRITKVFQTRVYSDNMNRWIWNVDGLLLENGMLVTFHTAELEGDYATVATILERNPKKENA